MISNSTETLKLFYWASTKYLIPSIGLLYILYQIHYYRYATYYYIPQKQTSPESHQKQRKNTMQLLMEEILHHLGMYKML